MKELEREERNFLDLAEESEFDSRSLEVEKLFTDEGGVYFGDVPRTSWSWLGAPTGLAEMARGMAETERRRYAASFMMTDFQQM